MDKHEVTTNELMEFLQEHMVTREEFHRLDEKVDKLDERVSGLDVRVSGLDVRVGGLEVKINQTKLDILDAMDEKLGRLKGDLVVMLRDEDKKLMMMVKKLKEKHIFDDGDVSEFLAMIPFPQLIRPSR